MSIETQDVARVAAAAAEPFLRATEVIDWTESEVLGLARSLAAGRNDLVAVSRACLEWVRDEIQHCMDYELMSLARVLNVDPCWLLSDDGPRT